MIELKVNETIFVGWQTIRINQSLANLDAGVVISGKKYQHEINVGDTYQVYYQGVLIQTGRVNESSESLEGHLSLQGQSLTADASRAKIDKQFQKIKLSELINKLLTPFKIELDYQGKSDPIIKQEVLLSKSPLEVITTALARFGLLAVVLPNGKVRVLNSSGEPTSARLEQGLNISKAQINKSIKGQHSSYTIHTETSKATEQNASLGFYCPYSQKTADINSLKEAQQAAKWIQNLRAATSEKLTIATKDWFCVNKTPWKINQLVEVFIPKLGVDKTLLVESTSLSFSQQDGYSTELNLVSPKAYQAKPISKKDTSTKAPASENWGDFNNTEHEGGFFANN